MSPKTASNTMAMASHNPWCVSPVIAMPTRMMTNLSARVANAVFHFETDGFGTARAYDVTNDVIIDTMAAAIPIQLM